MSNNLLDLHDAMIKTAADEVKKQEEVDIIVKYATEAEEELSKLGDDYSEEDVIKVAEFLIEQDMSSEAEYEKIAEYDALGRIMARSFKDELSVLDTEKASE